MKKQYKEWPLITREENHNLQLKHDNLIQRIRNTSAFLEGADDAIKERNKAKLLLEEWNAYLACDQIPKPFQTEQVRSFFFKASYFEAEDVELTVNWQLGVDERSILNQDIDSINLTKRYLKDTRIDFGEQYEKRINDTMEILKRIKNFLENPNVVLSTRIMADVLELSFFAYRQINEYINNLCYRILFSEEAYMDEIDTTTAEYAYTGKNFDIHLWTFKNVPIYLDPVDTSSKTIKLYKVNIKLVVPFSVLCENMVIRGLHCHFDHFSARARYNELPKTAENEGSLRICLHTEWEIQKKIQNDVRAYILKQRADFEEAVRLKAEEDELRAKARKQEEGDKKAQAPKGDKGAKPKKPPKEPQIATANYVPVVRADFLLSDAEEYEETRTKYHFNTFGLTTGEVNLRKFQILGGVYQLNCISKPRVINFPNLIMSWYKPGGKTHNLDSLIESAKSDDVSKFFQITFLLPECYCQWGEPMPCLFEDGSLYQKEATNVKETDQTLQIHSPVIINDFNLHQLFTKPLMYRFIENTIPRVISSFKFPEDFFDEEDDKKAKATLGRAKLTPEEIERERELAMEKQRLAYEAQYCPERLFPLYKKVLPVIILPNQDEENIDTTLYPYKHFSDFMAAVEMIKTSYRTSTFKDKTGNPVTILAERYDRNIRRPRMISKLFFFEKDEIRRSNANLKTQQSRVTICSSDSMLSSRHSEMEIAKEIDTPTSAPGKGSKKKRASKGKMKPIFAETEVEVEKVDDKTITKWSTANILKTVFNPQEKKITIWTDRLGTFGFAYYRYQHFPFQSWSITPSLENADEVQLKIESLYALFRIYISAQGYRILVTDFSKKLKTRKVYLNIKQPESDLKVVKEKLQQSHLNIFPERDACWYMTGYFCEKHLSAECHIYNCMSLYATTFKYSCSFWNKLSNRRTMVLKFGEIRDAEDDMFLLRLTPEDVMFVEIKEVCTDLDVIQLEYTPTWRNVEWYPDLNHLITSTYNGSEEWRIKNPSLLYNLKTLLQAIRLLSSS